MTSRLRLRPREPWMLRNAIATHVVAQVLAALPIGYWQRRLAARAWALAHVPDVPRESQRVQTWRQPGGPPLWVLETEVMTWGLVAWQWRDDPRADIAAAARVVRRFSRSVRRPRGAIVFVVPDHDHAPRAALLRLRLAPDAATDIELGIVTWADLERLCTEAARDLAALRPRHAAAYGAQMLARLADADAS